MKKMDFITEVAGKVEMTKKDIAIILDTIEETIDAVIANGDEVTVFGTKFGVKKQVAKQGVSAFNGGKEWSTPEKIVPYAKITKKKKKDLSKEI